MNFFSNEKSPRHSWQERSLVSDRRLNLNSAETDSEGRASVTVSVFLVPATPSR